MALRRKYKPGKLPTIILMASYAMFLTIVNNFKKGDLKQ
jgi:hypothetical protein